MCLTLVVGRPFDPNLRVVVVVVPKGVHLHPGAEKVVDLVEGILLFPEVFDQVLITRVGTGVIDWLCEHEYLTTSLIPVRFIRDTSRFCTQLVYINSYPCRCLSAKWNGRG